MARPRKGSPDADARRRILDAFWGLLEKRPLREVTVGSVVEAAGCNRGTFYYYFADMEALVMRAVEEDLLADGVLAHAIFIALVNGTPDALVREVPRERLERAALIMRSGELQQVELAVRRAVLRLWTRRVCGPGEDLAPAACFAVQFVVGGVLGYIMYASRTGALFRPIGLAERVYLARVARETVEAVARAQGLEPVEVIARICATEPAEAISSRDGFTNFSLTREADFG